jgi:nicotinate-nucleotide adenylyltransferase
MKVGIFGGTFNPIHTGHLVVAQDALEALRLDSVMFLPCANPPHKSPESLAPASQRLQMIRAAIKGDDRFSVSDIEIKRGGKSYSVDTVRELRRRHPRTDWFFIIGSDSFKDLHGWREIETLSRLCEFVVVARPTFDMRKMTAGRIGLDAATFKRVSRHQLRAHLVDISSTEIRERVRAGKSIRYLVPPAVAAHIKKNSLYR